MGVCKPTREESTETSGTSPLRVVFGTGAVKDLSLQSQLCCPSPGPPCHLQTALLVVRHRSPGLPSSSLHLADGLPVSITLWCLQTCFQAKWGSTSTPVRSVPCGGIPAPPSLFASLCPADRAVAGWEKEMQAWFPEEVRRGALSRGSGDGLIDLCFTTNLLMPNF